jgi:hypothetical protein
MLLVVLTFFMPNGFFMVWANYFALAFSFVFILLGLVLLIDFAHTWSETCLDRWEETNAPFWKYTLIGSTLGMYSFVLVMTGVLYGYFTGTGCGLNTTFITINLFLVAFLTALCVSPSVQEANPRSGLAQSSMVGAYCTYLITSAILNHDDVACNPITRGRAGGVKNTTVVLGALFTFLAIAYSTSRAATQSKALVGRRRAALATAAPSHGEELAGYGATDVEAPTTTQPKRKESLRIQALQAAVDAGSLPASALEEDASDDDDDELDSASMKAARDENDDERNGTRYNYAFFHFIFAIAACYVAMLLTDW